MKSKKFIAMTMAAALALSLTGTALATSTTPGAGGNIPGSDTSVPGDAEIAANGNTTIGIMQTKVDPTNMSFEVPLYVTMAVVDGETAVVVPDNYGITNTSTADPIDTNHKYQSIGVVAMSFEKLEDSGFKTVITAPTANEDEIMLSIGKVTMPALSGKGTAAVTLDGDFGTATNPTAIELGDTLPLLLKGTVLASTNRTEAAAVAQFKVKYTLSLLNSSGAPLGSVYAGDDANAAGMPGLIPVP